MNPETAKKLAQMGDVKANSQKLKIAIEKAKANPDHPDSVELRRRLERGMFNVELQALGMKPFPVQQPKIDLGAAMAAAKPQMVEGASVQSRAPEQISVLGIDTDLTKTGIREKVGDVVETARGVVGQFGAAGRDIVDTIKRDDRSLAEKTVMIGGRAFQGGAGAFGEATIGLGKLALSQNAEDQLKDLATSTGEAISETALARKAADWYENLDENDKDMVNAAGGFASVLAEIVGVKGAGRGLSVAKEGFNAAAPIVREGVEATGDVIQAGARKVDDLFTTSDATLERRIQEQFQKGVKPTIRGKENLGQVEKYKSNAATAVDVITKNKNNLKYVDDVGEVVTGKTPESLKEFSEAITQTKEQIFKQYDGLAKKAGEQGLQIDVASLSDELDSVITDRALNLSNPEAVAYAKSVKDRFSTAGPLTADEAQNVIKNYNNSLQAFYRNPTPEGLTRNAVDALMVNQVRKSLDQGIGSLTGGQYQSLKNQYGALRTIEKDVLNATLRDARKNAAGLIDFTDILTGGQLVTSLASMNPAGIAGAAAQSGIKRWLKYLNDPNTQVKKMFKTSEKLNSRDPNAMGAFEQSITEPAVGMSIRSTVTPAKVGAQLSEREFDMMVEALDDVALARTQPDFNELLTKYGLQNAQDDELVKFIRQATDEFETPGATERSVNQSFNHGATPATTVPKYNTIGLQDKYTDLAEVMFRAPEDLKLYRGLGKGIGNSTFVNGEYWADSRKFAETFGDVSEGSIPKNAAIFDFDLIKNNASQTLIPKKLLVDPKALTDYLIKRGVEYTKNTNSRGVEYVKLNKVLNELENKATTMSKTKFKEHVLANYDKYRSELARRERGFNEVDRSRLRSGIDDIWEEANQSQ